MRTRPVVSAVLGILIFPGISHAACTPASGNGTWDYYSAALNGTVGWNACTTTVTNGNVTGNCVTNAGTTTTVRGTLVIATNCRVTGTMTHTLTGGTRYTVTLAQATLGAANAVIAGTARSSLGQAITFQGVRR